MACLPCGFSSQVHLSLVFHQKQLVCLKIYCFIYFSWISVKRIISEQRSFKRVISYLFICYILVIMHLILIKLLTQITVKEESKVSYSWPCIYLPFTYWKVNLVFFIYESNKHHRLKFLIFMLHEAFVTTYMYVHCMPLSPALITPIDSASGMCLALSLGALGHYCTTS